MKKFHLTITNNETGEIERELDTNAIIGSADDGDGTAIFCYTRCGLVELAATCAGALDAADHGMKDMPKPLLRKIKKIRKSDKKHLTKVGRP